MSTCMDDYMALGGSLGIAVEVTTKNYLNIHKSTDRQRKQWKARRTAE